MIDDFIEQMARMEICPNSGEPLTPYEINAVRHHIAFGKAVVRRFVAEVNKKAEANIEKTHRLEGSHYAAMTSILAALEQSR